jgi:hypothetical protein
MASSAPRGRRPIDIGINEADPKIARVSRARSPTAHALPEDAQLPLERDRADVQHAPLCSRGGTPSSPPRWT